jgi:hypothetical protein
MLKVISVVAAFAVALTSFPAVQANELELLSSPWVNRLQIVTEGDGNELIIVQEAARSAFADAGNTLEVAIFGDRNGGPAGSRFSGIAGQSGLQPGLLSQTGLGNMARLTVAGSDNLFAMVQQGSGNVLTASITGSYNEMSVFQSGAGNITSISQNGIGNSISVTQRSW